MVISTSHAQRPPELFVREERLAPPRLRPTVYLDTTIPTYFAASMSADISRARMQRITRIWWTRYRRHCDVFISDLLLAEARDGSEYAARKRLAALDSIDAACLSERSEALFQSLLADGLIPDIAHADAEHISYAATNSIRFLLTWNCKHLANRMIFRRVTQRCESLGFYCPQVCTPETMIRVCVDERRTD